MQNPLLNDRSVGGVGMDGVAVYASSRSRTFMRARAHASLLRATDDGLSTIAAPLRACTVWSGAMKDDGGHSMPDLSWCCRLIERAGNGSKVERRHRRTLPTPSLPPRMQVDSKSAVLDTQFVLAVSRSEEPANLQ